jgi:hypothetical protein
MPTKVSQGCDHHQQGENENTCDEPHDGMGALENESVLGRKGEPRKQS